MRRLFLLAVLTIAISSCEKGGACQCVEEIRSQPSGMVTPMLTSSSRFNGDCALDGFRSETVVRINGIRTTSVTTINCK